MFLKKKYHNLADEQLMAHITKGEEKAFEVLYQRYADKLYRYFYRMLNQNEAKANDFTQDLFMKVIEKPHYFDTKRRFSTWIYAIAGNMCKNEYRRMSKFTMTHEVPDMELPKNLDFFTDNFDKRLFEQYLQLALNELGEVPRQCFVLRYQEEKSIKEISDIMDCPEGTVKSRLYYTIKKLAEKLKVFH